MKKKLIIFAAIVIITVFGGAVAWKKQSRTPAFSSPRVENKENNNEKKYVAECKDCNVIMISLSNVSAEHMSLYGYERVTTPHLDAWAKDAIVFENAFTQSSWTLPVGVSLFTSLYPYSHGVTDRYENNVLSENVKTFPEILRENGYATAAFTGGLDYSKAFGHMRGFNEIVQEGDDVDWPTDFAGFKVAFPKAKQWLGKKSKDKFFLFVHAYDTHCPFLPPQGFAGVFSGEHKDIAIDNSLCLRGYRNNEKEEYKASYFKDEQQEVTLTQNDIDFLKDSYDEEILSVDSLVADFLQNLDEETVQKTIIVIFSDHGEMFAKHGRFGRAGAIRGTLYDDVLHIPLMIKIPQQAGVRVNKLAQIIDVMPTVLKVLDVHGDIGAQGKDLMSENANDHVFSGSEFNVGIFNSTYKQKSVNEAVRDYEWKLIHEVKFSDPGFVEDETFELYDIKNDKDELHNVINNRADIADGLKSILNEWRVESKKIRSGGKTEKVPDGLSEEARKRGYW